MAAFGLDFGDLVPSEDWELNVLLLEIAKGLSEEEFCKIKFLCSGTKGIPKGSLERLNTPEKFFVHLRERGMVSRDNLLLLQAFLWHLDRQDLHEMAADYARKVGDTLYFYTPKDDPEEGFKHIQFHVDGNLDRFQRSDLEALRATMARLLFVPQQFIFLHGVEPTGSLTLTFMIHEECVTPLRRLFKEHKDSFGNLGVDGIFVDGTEYFNSPPLGRRSSAPAGPATEREMSELFRRNVKLENIAAETEVRLLETQDIVCRAQREVSGWRRKEAYFRSLLVRAAEAEAGSARGGEVGRRGEEVVSRHLSLV
ncbi:uncharacterized protein LOC106014045 [Aplysia californica]|uniref:Uncharacterized protein LOC106014045 n=1 Tax=Aplysia californica TaxID=6500 RepID=A0ABM1W4M5_APLCA|nr:uncharacterized protein LOC106014045 [Aplysia californica]